MKEKIAWEDEKKAGLLLKTSEILSTALWEEAVFSGQRGEEKIACHDNAPETGTDLSWGIVIQGYRHQQMPHLVRTLQSIRWYSLWLSRPWVYRLRVQYWNFRYLRMASLLCVFMLRPPCCYHYAPEKENKTVFPKAIPQSPAAALSQRQSRSRSGFPTPWNGPGPFAPGLVPPG